MNALIISPDPSLREHLAVALRAVERRSGEPWTFLEATDGISGLRIASRARPELVVADEIASGAGGFAVARDLRGALEPFEGGIVLILARAQDRWLAEWSGADAWLTKPVDPFALADEVMRLVRRPSEERV